MKKAVGLIIAVMMMALLAACGNNAGGQESSAPTEKEAANDNSQSTYGKDDLGRVFSASIEETVLVDEQEVKITAQELTYSGYAATLSLLIENNSDRELSFYAGTMGYSMNSINGYMISDGYIGEDVAAGMSAKVSMDFNLDQLSMYGITDIADIGLGIQIKDGYDDYLSTGPLEIKTSAADSYNYDKDTFKDAMDEAATAAVFGYTVNYKAGDKLFDDYGVTILNEYVITNKNGEQSLLMEVANNSGKDLYVAESDVFVNNVNDYGGRWDSEFIVNGKKTVLSLSFDLFLDRSYLELLGMEKYTDCSMTIVLMDDNYNDIGSGDIEIVFDGKTSPDSFVGDVLYDNNGFKLMKVGLVEDSLSYSDDLHALVLMKNTSGKKVEAGSGFNDVYVNKFKVSGLSINSTARDGGYALIDIELQDYDLEDNNLDISNITELNTKIEISDGQYHNYDEPEITMTF